MKVLRWIGIGLGFIMGIVLLAAVGLLVYGSMSFKPTHNRPVYQIAADTSPAGVQRGEYLVRSVMGCADCHSPNSPDGELIGISQEVNEGPISGIFSIPNLTPDMETGLGSWSDAEIARAIREGLDKDGVELVLMPSANYHIMSDADVAAIVGYLRYLEPVNNPLPPFSINIVGKALQAMGILGPRSLGDPITEPVVAPAPGSAAEGEYLVGLGGCRDCHQENLNGGAVPFAGEDTPAASNLTPGGELAGWSKESFITAMRTGMTPSGRQMNGAMPWKVYSRMSDSDLAAIYNYLRGLPALTSQK